jgi:hypothetical protein
MDENVGGVSGGLLALGDMLSVMAASTGAQHGRPGGHWAAALGQSLGQGTLALKEGFTAGRERRDQQRFQNWAGTEAMRSEPGSRREELLQGVAMGPSARPYLNLLPSLWNADAADSARAIKLMKLQADSMPKPLTDAEFSNALEASNAFYSSRDSIANLRVKLGQNSDLYNAKIAKATQALDGIYDPSHARRVQFYNRSILQNVPEGLKREEMVWDNYLPVTPGDFGGTYKFYSPEEAAALRKQYGAPPEMPTQDDLMSGRYGLRPEAGGIPMQAGGLYGYNPAYGATRPSPPVGNGEPQIPQDASVTNEGPTDETPDAETPPFDTDTFAGRVGNWFDEKIDAALGYFGKDQKDPRGSAFGEPTAQERLMAMAKGEDPDATPAFTIKPMSEQVPFDPSTDIANLFTTRHKVNPEIARLERQQSFEDLPMSDKLVGLGGVAALGAADKAIRAGRFAADTGIAINSGLLNVDNWAKENLSDQSLINYATHDLPLAASAKVQGYADEYGPSLPGMYTGMASDVLAPQLWAGEKLAQGASYGVMPLVWMGDSFARDMTDLVTAGMKGGEKVLGIARDFAGDIGYAAQSGQKPMDAMLQRQSLERRRREILNGDTMRRSLMGYGSEGDDQYLYSILSGE